MRWYLEKVWPALRLSAAGYEAMAVSGQCVHADGHWTDAGTQRRLSARPWLRARDLPSRLAEHLKIPGTQVPFSVMPALQFELRIG